MTSQVKSFRQHGNPMHSVIVYASLIWVCATTSRLCNTPRTIFAVPKAIQLLLPGTVGSRLVAFLRMLPLGINYNENSRTKELKDFSSGTLYHVLIMLVLVSCQHPRLQTEARCFFFIVLCPAVQHEDGHTLSHSSWEERGWCRMEQMARELLGTLMLLKMCAIGIWKIW